MKKEGSEISTTSRCWDGYLNTRYATACIRPIVVGARGRKRPASAEEKIRFLELPSDSEDFQYVVKRQGKAKVCFGSGLERELLDFDKKGMVSKHARSNMHQHYDVGPATYDVTAQTSALSGVLNRPTSKRGTVLGGRTEERKGAFKIWFTTPGPIYKIPSPFTVECKDTRAPFNSGEERMKPKIPDVPGVGYYKVAPYKRRRAPFAHSFGGKKCLLPVVKMKCGPFNFDACERCGKYPEGDYWYLDTVEVENMGNLKKAKKDESDGIFLCRPCYDLEKLEHKIFNKKQMRNFKKIRDCSKVHFHNGCVAKLFLVPPKEIEKVKEREGYLSLYFS